MNIEQHLTDHFHGRLQSRRCLVVHDPDGLYGPILDRVVGKDGIYIDASKGLLESREEAMVVWSHLTRGAKKPGYLLIRVPYPSIDDREEQVNDPFAAFSLLGAKFPSGDDESYESLCRDALPDRDEDVRKLFAQGIPSFASINALAGGRHWPRLQDVLAAESPREILSSLLTPTDAQQKRMKASSDWKTEAFEFLKGMLDFAPTGKNPSWKDALPSVWRHLLFSEFIFDLPGEVPGPLAGVSRAPVKARELVFRVCALLRESRSARPVYLEQAEKVALDMKLESLTGSVDDFGERDTFAFQERCFLRKHWEAIRNRDWELATRIADSRRNSVWVQESSDRQLAWAVSREALDLLQISEAVREEIDTLLTTSTALIDYYVARGYRLDTVHRRFEQYVLEAMHLADEFGDLVALARESYHGTTERLQQRFLNAVRTGWQIPGMLRASKIFPSFLAPMLEKKGTRVAYFLVDAFRFELAVAFRSGLEPGTRSDLDAICAQLPCITRIGMAALLPGADTSLEIKYTSSAWVPHIAGIPVLTPEDRLNCLRRQYGDRCAMIELGEFVKATTKKQEADSYKGVDLLLIRTNEIDEQGEIGAETLHGGVRIALSRLNAALKKLQKIGFDHAVITADHGFHLSNPDQIGNLVSKPAGQWTWQKSRVLLGQGEAGPSCFAWNGQQAGLSGDFDSLVFPFGMGTFEKVPGYFHEGISLQESIIPLLRVELRASSQETSLVALPDVQVSYRGKKSGIVTTLRPVVDLCVFGEDLFAGGTIRLKVEIVSNGSVVGCVSVCPQFNEALGCLEVEAGQALKIPLRLNEDFKGTFDVMVTDPLTGIRLAEPVKLDLEIL